MIYVTLQTQWQIYVCHNEEPVETYELTKYAQLDIRYFTHCDIKLFNSYFFLNM